MNLALVTPWPPMKTGIADYAYDLVNGLVNKGENVTVFTLELSPKPLSNVEFKDPSELRIHYQDFDRVIYQMGNNSDFHLHMIDLIYSCPGIVHLHDLSLHHIMAWVLYANGEQSLYYDLINKWYGPTVKSEMNSILVNTDELPWETALVGKYPLFEEVVGNSSHCIVHSEYAKNKIQNVFPLKNITVIPQLYLNTIINDFEVFDDDCFQIGIFGGVDFNKKIDVILFVIKRLHDAGVNFKLNVVGAISKECESLFETFQDGPYSNRIQLHGRVTHDEFINTLSQMDLCIALRYPTMGETSAVVMRSLQLNVPVIVSDIGWYAELPCFVPKIDPESQDEAEILYEYLKTYSMKSESYLKLLAEISLYSKETWNFERSVDSYIAQISE